MALNCCGARKNEVTEGSSYHEVLLAVAGIIIIVLYTVRWMGEEGVTWLRNDLSMGIVFYVFIVLWMAGDHVALWGNT